MQLVGQIVDIRNRRIFSGVVTVIDGKISAIEPVEHEETQYILPGFIDAHIHIESSLLVPSEFAPLAVVHGTVATISDPHEIANVLGVAGVEFMIENGKQSPLKFHFGAPSCVPATGFETAGAEINADAIRALMDSQDIYYLAEMMNYPGVLHDDPEVLQKLHWAKLSGKPLDGHAPGLRGAAVKKYIDAGISTDHECFTYEEALEKLQLGMKVIIREGSAAKNFDALIELAHEYYERLFFCSDDKHPDDLLLGHINDLCARAVAKGVDVFKVLQMACLNPVEHYNMNVGTLRPNDPADFIIVNDLIQFKVKATYINGNLVAQNGQAQLPKIAFETPNNFHCSPKTVADFAVNSSAKTIRVIEALEGQLITKELHLPATLKSGQLCANPEQDILKLAVVNRYADAPVAVAFIKNFGLQSGAIASSVAHDCHNIVAVGASDEALCKAVNLLIAQQGGLAAVSAEKELVLPLPVAGIMSDQDGVQVAAQYQALDAMAKELGSNLKAPYMTLSFMALLVIPDLKLSDKGLFSGNAFAFVDLEVD
jgi:adenine deaminase